ncbi:MAG: MarR family winged helix-turn-helix transcriptional regulator [Polyangiales bacterium]|nr:winged helix-turn-helix transcriptional regulator [Myxococcales bacterium]MCB9658039.1 winged helix-turn-helix transcriptional regulator [Sandaracinaceae bacterium]
MSSIPLARLFAMGMNTLVTGLHARLAERGFPDVRPAFAFVLLAARDRSLTGNDVAELMGMTKQAASKLIDAMEAEHFVSRKPHPADARAKVLQIAPRGRRLLATAESIYAELEDEWAEVLGRARVDAMRSDLTEVLLATNDGALPAIRPSR